MMLLRPRDRLFPRLDARAAIALAILYAAAIFLIDAFTELDDAISVLYVIDILFVASTLPRRATIVAGITAAILTVIGYLFSHAGRYPEDMLSHCVVSLLANAVTTFLGCRNQDNTNTLEEQVELLNLTHDAIIVYDMNGTITFWNDGAEHVYGWSAQEASGRAIDELLDTRFPVFPAQIQTELATFGRWRGELQRTRKDGATVVISSRLALWRDAAGKPRAVLATSNDLTETRRAQDALARSTAELAHVSRISLLGEMAASITHEVAQPITGIITCGEAALRWLDRPTPEIGEAMQLLRLIMDDANRATAIISRIRVMAQKRDHGHALVDLNATVKESLELVRRELSAQAVQVELELHATDPKVHGDRVQLQQVLINLVMNGAQAMREITGPRKLIAVATHMSDEASVTVSVRDFGAGIKHDDSERLFTPFFTTKADGMGMGLSICRSIVESHAGKIWAESPLEGGALLQFRLPCVR